MGRVLLCVGHYAKVPFYLEAFSRYVYCMEELCHSLFEHAYLLNKNIMNRKLIDWIEDECNCQELARELRKFLNSGSSVESFVVSILEYVGYSSKEEMGIVSRVLRSNANLAESEKGKLYADYLLENKRYEKAISEYKSLRQKLTQEETVIRGKLTHNLGVAYARLFLFEQAAKYFNEAYTLTGQEASKQQYLAAMRMYLSEQDYIVKFADQKETYFVSLELEKQVEYFMKEMESAERIVRLEAIINKQKNNQKSAYYEEIRDLVCELKEEYRKEI